MWAWLSRMLRGTRAAERAEADGRVEDAVRLYVDAGERDEAVRVLLRAAEVARTLEERRDAYTRAFALARTETLRDAARRGIALVTLAEFESVPPRTDDERRRLTEGARDLESLGAWREAAQAWQLLDDREAIVRVLTLSGDVDTLESLTDAREAADRHGLRRRGALEDFDVLWRSGDRARALEGLRAWVAGAPDDHEARQHLDDHHAKMLRGGRFEADLDGESVVVVGRFPVTFGREADVVVRGAAVSRRHLEVSRQGDGFVVRDAGSRGGTLLDGLPLAGEAPLVSGHTLSLGADLALEVEGDGAGAALRIARGLDRGRRVALVADAWALPEGAGMVRFCADGPTLSPAAPVSLNGQRVAVAFLLARGDRVEWGARRMDVRG